MTLDRRPVAWAARAGIAAMVACGVIAAGAAAQAPQDPAAEKKAEAKDDKAGKPVAKKGSATKGTETVKKTKGMPKARVASPGDDDRYAKYTRKPGQESYAKQAPDFSRLPPWKQASFFGIRAEGQVFVYVVDCSGSMDDDARLLKAKTELRKSIGRLKYPQKFLVIFYSDHPRMMPGGIPVVADQTNKDDFNTWLDTIDADGGTEPREATTIGLSYKPDALFLLSDGAFEDGTDALITARNKHKTPIHCVDLSAGRGGDQLRNIAKGSGGDYIARQ